MTGKEIIEKTKKLDTMITTCKHFAGQYNEKDIALTNILLSSANQLMQDRDRYTKAIEQVIIDID